MSLKEGGQLGISIEKGEMGLVLILESHRTPGHSLEAIVYHRQLWGLVVLGMPGLFCARLGVAQVITEAWWLASMGSGLFGSCTEHSVPIPFPCPCQLPLNLRPHQPQNIGRVCILVLINSTCLMFL